MYSFKLPSSVKRIVSYIRKSRDEELQEEKDHTFNALERQRIQMERVVKNFNIPFDEEMEYGSGDKIEYRPVFQRVLDEIRKDKYQAIAVREIQRLGRGSYEDMGQIYTLLDEKRIYLITETRVYDLRNKDDAKFIRMQLFLSREEYFFIKERLQGAREFFAGEGKFMSSRPPYGYSSNRKTKVLEVNPEQAKYVKMIFEWYAYGDEKEKTGFGYQAIATKLTTMGVRTYTGKKSWQPLNIARMLKNRAYIGEIIYKATERVGNKQIQRPIEEQIIVKDAHEAIVSRELFDKVQEKLVDKKSILPIILEFDPCELAGLITCNCGRKMVRQYSIQRYRKKDSDDVSIYHKEFLYCRGECKRTIKYRDVENYIIAGLNEFAQLPDDLLLEVVATTINERDNKNDNISENIISILEKQKKTLRDRLKFIFEQYEDRAYSKGEFNERKTTVTDELEKVEIELEREIKKNQNIEQTIALDELRNNLMTVVQTYKVLAHKSNKNELLRSIIEEVTVDVLEKGRGTRPSKLGVNIELKYSFIKRAQV